MDYIGIEQVIKMTNANYHVFGIGMGADDLHYIGWTQKSLGEERDEIFSDVAGSGDQDIAQWLEQALRTRQISLFEIESVPSAEDAKDCALCLCHYYRSLGLVVLTARC